MAKNSLRAYNREIENLIERGQTEEAIAHCKYILKQFPKHLDTYRLLGKTYLESQRYSEAADILQRVLSSIPDDFVSQLGMSIIREDEGNLDAAIWHMERAFEVQPANTAIQDELRRLYGRRDGVEPPKVRLTRGALVRMYARGELFTQAISEARAAVAEDPQRIDLEIILARMYYLAGHKVEATEVCSRLVSKLPYCFEANRILTDILPSTSRAEDAKTFQQNLNALDPYAAFISPAAPASDQVPDQAVLIESLDWTPSAEGEEPPAWTRTAGVEYKQETSDLPDWLDTLAPSALTSAPHSEPPTPPFEDTFDFSTPIPKADATEIPEWMREAGWSESAEDKEEPASVFDLAGEDREELAEAELPSWLKDMAPPVEDEQITAEEQARLDLLESILPPETAVEIPSAEEEALSDALMDEEATPEETVQPASDIPEWLSDIDIVEESTIYSTGRTGALPKWLEDELASDEVEAEELPDEELPEWLRRSDQDKTTITPGSTLEPTSELAGDDEEMAGIAWLESLVDNQGVGRETFVTSSEGQLESPPDWVTQESEDQQEQLIPGPFDVVPDAAAPEGEQIVHAEEFSPNESPSGVEESAVYAADLHIEELEVEELTQSEEEILPAISEESDQTDLVSEDVFEPTTIEEPSADRPDFDTMESPAPAAPSDDVEDIDAALAWLESLAEKQGADEETLSVRPEDRLDTPPEWVREEMLTSAAEDLEEIAPEAAAEPLTAADETILEAASDVDEVELPSAQPEAPETPAADMDEDAAFAWLESLAARQGAEEDTLLTAPDDRVETPPEWVYEQTGEPAEPIETEVAETPADTSITEETPSWIDEISHVDAEDTVETGAERGTEAVDWFTELPSETPASAAEFEPQEVPVESMEPVEEEPQTLPDWMAELTADTDVLETEAPSAEHEGELFMEEEMPPLSSDEAAEAPEEGLLAFEEPAEEDITKPVRIYPPVSESQEEETPVEASIQSETADFEIPPDELASPISIEAEQTEETGFFEEEPQETTEASSADMLEVEAPGEVEIMPAAIETETLEFLEEEEIPEAAETTETELAEAPEPEMVFDEPLAEAEEELLPDVSQEAVVEQLLSDDLPQTTRQQAFTLLDAGKIDAAMVQYNQVIESGELLDVVIEDLRKALDRYPVDISIWQTLGDAYLRNDQVQEALDSYTKAEELLR